MTMGTATVTPAMEERCPVSFMALCNDVRSLIHECGGFKNAAKRVLQEHGINNPDEQEILLKELHAEIRRERQAYSRPKSPEKPQIYAETLIRFEVPLGHAIEKACAQFKIKEDSPMHSRLYALVTEAHEERLASKIAQRRAKLYAEQEESF
jgi:hypothetical protein